MKFSNNKNTKLIFENWRKFVNEESDAVKAFIAGKNQGLEDFVTTLKQVASDPEFRELALSGHHDKDGPPDEALTVTGGQPVAAKNLTPTQMDIDMDASLGDQMVNKWTPASTEAALADIVTMPSPGGAIPLLTYANKFILDGHHRWSQVMMTNPDGLMTVDNLSGDALPNAEVALKATQLAIAALAGQVVTKGTKKNLLNATEEEVETYVLKHITDEVLGLLAAAGKISKPDRQEAADYYKGNLAAIKEKEPGKFEREKGMPQADDSKVPQAKVNKALEQGLVNFDEPSVQDLVQRRRAEK
jgi:hypothetical protein